MTDKQMDDLAIRVATKVVKAIFNVSSEVHLVFENHTEKSDFIVESQDDLDKQTLDRAYKITKLIRKIRTRRSLRKS